MLLNQKLKYVVLLIQKLTWSAENRKVSKGARPPCIIMILVQLRGGGAAGIVAPFGLRETQRHAVEAYVQKCHLDILVAILSL